MVKNKYFTLYKDDCFNVFPLIKDESIDLILADLPYGITKNKWDKILSFKLLWKEYKRIIKNNGNIVIFSSQPFTSLLVVSNSKMFKYEWIWIKNLVTGFANAKKRPLKIIENILVFGNTQSKYYPQGLIMVNKIIKNSKNPGGESIGNFNNKYYTQIWTNYPRNILKYKNDNIKLHPTQKPVKLLSYLIKTYT